MEHTFLTSHAERACLRRQAFSLLELLIVIAIIGILISVGVVSYSSAQQKSRNSRRISDMKAVQSAWEQYYADHNGNYPALCSEIMTTYLPAGLPSDPRGSGGYTYDFTFCSETAYCFCAHLENAAGNAAANPVSPTCSFGSGQYYCVGNLQ
jgi:prepilin-type N-terminal cleavage/methylation domain-containing protein